MKKIITSESVNIGHPDKTCDTIADAFLDAALAQDENAMMAVECAIKDNKLFIYGEATTKASIDYENIAREILKKFPEATVVNEGEAEVLLEYSAVKKNQNKLLVLLKIIFISIILFAGGATAIMSFHADGEIPEILQTYYSMFMGENNEKPYILEIPYSIGLAVGIIVFYNHFIKTYYCRFWFIAGYFFWYF